MDNHKLIGLVLPTNESQTIKDFLCSDESLKNFQSCRNFVTFLINFQHYSEESIQYVLNQLNKFGFHYKFTVNSYDLSRGVPVNKIRYDAMSLMPDAKFYALIDDDFKFQGPSEKMKFDAGMQYLFSAKYMLTYSLCGLVLMGSSLYRKAPTYHIKGCDFVNTYLTGKGFMFRNIPPALPMDCIELVGSDEEKLIAARLLSMGYYPAKFRLSRTLHYENNVVSGKDMYHWNTEEILMSNNNRYIKDHFYSEYKGGYEITNELKWRNTYPGSADMHDDSDFNFENESLKSLTEDINRRI